MRGWDCGSLVREKGFMIFHDSHTRREDDDGGGSVERVGGILCSIFALGIGSWHPW